MARDHAEVYISIWDDADFIKLSPGAQRLYFVLLSQRRLEHSGVQPLRVSMWAELSSETTEDDIWAALDELVERGFIVLDKRTSEVLIRSFFRRDVAKPGKRGGMNANLVRNALDACNRVDSPILRAVLVREVYRAAPLPLEVTECVERFPDLSEAPSEAPTEGG
jgi:hypothetical protein